MTATPAAGFAYCARLHAAAARSFGFLGDAGFRRAHERDACESTHASIAFLGRHRGFVVDYDVRDDAVGVRLVGVAGAASPEAMGAPSRGVNVFTVLVARHGYRGGIPAAAPQGRPHAGDSSDLDAQVDAWARLLSGPGAVLLRDEPLPDDARHDP